MTHNRVNYQKGCRCAECVEANTNYKRSLQTYYIECRAAGITPGGLENVWDLHGNAKTYEWYGCRCQECKEAVRLDRNIKRQVAWLRRQAVAQRLRSET